MRDVAKGFGARRSRSDTKDAKSSRHKKRNLGAYHTWARNAAPTHRWGRSPLEQRLLFATFASLRDLRAPESRPTHLPFLPDNGSNLDVMRAAPWILVIAGPIYFYLLSCLVIAGLGWIVGRLRLQRG